MNEEQELQLIKAAQNGDTQAYGKLASQYQNMVFTLCMRMQNNREDAEDICQEILVKVFQRINKYSHQAPFGAWLYRLSYNENINMIRKNKRLGHTVDVTENEKENWTDTKNVLDTIEASERKEIILRALDTLGEVDRYLIMAFYFEELPIKEISVATGLTESNIKIKLHRSRKAMYAALNHPVLKENLI